MFQIDLNRWAYVRPVEKIAAYGQPKILLVNNTCTLTQTLRKTRNMFRKPALNIFYSQSVSLTIRGPNYRIIFH